MWSSRPAFQFSRYAILAAASLWIVPAFGQENQAPPIQQQATPETPPKPAQPYGGGSPLDVIMNTRLWTDVPEAKDFVKETRPPEDSLEYQPTAGTDPPRPKLRTPAELKALQDELENAGARNEKAAGIKKKNFQAVKVPKPKHVTAAAKTN